MAGSEATATIYSIRNFLAIHHGDPFGVAMPPKPLNFTRQLGAMAGSKATATIFAKKLPAICLVGN